MGAAARDIDPGEGFSKSRRLLRAADYARVFERAEVRASHGNLLLLARRNDRPGHRLGLVIAKKNVRLAVQRNRVKRIAREVFRRQPVTGPPLDVILLARRGLDQFDNGELAALLDDQWHRLLQRASGLSEDSRQNR